MKVFITKFCAFLFMLGLIVYGLLFWANTFTDFVIDDRYLNSEVVLIITLIAGLVATFMPMNKDEIIKNKNVN